MIPARFAHVAFCFLLSMIMSLIISGVSTVAARAGDVSGDFFAIWVGAWLFSWAVAFPSVLFVAPLARRIVSRLTQPQR